MPANLHTVSHFPPQIQNVLLDGVGELSPTGVGVCHGLGPDFRAGQRQIDDIAFPDMARVEQRGEDGEECAGIPQVYGALVSGGDYE